MNKRCSLGMQAFGKESAMRARSILLLAAVSLFGVVAAFGALPAPTNLTVNAAGDPIVLDWDDVVGAAKYSVDLEGTVTFDYATDAGLVEDQELVVKVSFGTSARTDGGLMGDSYLNIAKTDLEQALVKAIQAALPLEPIYIVVVDEFEGAAKVKALSPGKGSGAQSNPFSEPADLGPVVWP